MCVHDHLASGDVYNNLVWCLSSGESIGGQPSNLELVVTRETCMIVTNGTTWGNSMLTRSSPTEAVDLVGHIPSTHLLILSPLWTPATIGLNNYNYIQVDDLTIHTVSSGCTQ